MKHKITYVYWFLPVFLFLLQAVMTFNSFNQIRYEELNGSVQPILWFDERIVRNGIHTNIGWYALLLTVYKLFGFSLKTAAIVKLVFHALALFCLAILLKKTLGFGKAAPVLLIAGLSPSLLFFNTLALGHGFDLLILPMVFLLLYHLDFKKQYQALIITFAVFFLSMFTMMVYPSYMLFMPSLLIFYWLKLRQYKFYNNYNYYKQSLRSKDLKYYILTAVAAFLMPLVAGFLYVSNRSLLIIDREWSNLGIFRSYGQINLSEQTFVTGMVELIRDLFIDSTKSYHFEPYKVEFSDYYPILGLILLGFVIWRIWPQVKHKWILIGLPILEIILSLVVVSISTGGVRRATPILVAVYFLIAVVLFYIDKIKLKSVKVLAMIMVAIFLIHHLIAYPLNLFHIQDPSPFKIEAWSEPGESPQATVDRLVGIARKEDLYLDCRKIITVSGCWYDVMYSAIEGSCRWNNFDCHKIYGYSFREGRFKELSIQELWMQERLDNIGEVGYF